MSENRDRRYSSRYREQPAREKYPKVVCRYFGTSRGCLSEQCRFFHDGGIPSSGKSERKTLLDAPDSPFKLSRRDREEAGGREGGDRMEEGGRDRDEESCVEILEIPSENVACIVGKKGEMTKTLSSKFGDAYIHIPEASTTKGMLVVSVTIRGKYNTLKRVIGKIYEIFLNLKKDTSCMFELLYKYNIDVKDSAYAEKDAERPRKRSRLNLEVIPVEAFPRTTQDFEPEILPVETQFLINRDFNPIDPGEPSNHIDPGEPSNPINPGEPSKLLLQLPDKKGFLPLSQHCLLQPFAAETFHKSPLKVRANDIVTFIKFCNCCNGCNYGCFRNAVDMTGYIPMEFVSPDVIKFDCPFCDEITEFYEERDYLEHMVDSHFWKRLISFLPELPPYTCPLTECGETYQSIQDLLFHFGQTPHMKVAALILDSVGERVHKMKMKLKSNSNPEINNQFEHLTRMNGELEQSLATLSNKASEVEEENRLEIERLKAQLSATDLLREKLRELEAKEKEFKDMKNLESVLVHEQNLVRAKDAEITKLQKMTHQLRERLKASERVNAQLNSRNVISIDDDELEKTKKELNDAKKVLQSKDANIVQLSTQNNMLTVELKNLKTNGAHTNSSSPDHEKEIEKLTKKVNAQKQMLQVKQTEIDLLREQIEAADI